MIDSISLLAQNAYSRVNEQRVAENFSEANNFHAMVGTAFNKFAHMSPDQILQHITQAKTSSADFGNVAASSGIVESMMSDMRKKLRVHEDKMRGSVIHESSLADLAIASNEAKNAVQVLVATRDKLLDGFEKIMNMQI